ncbi:MAG: response regulator [Granulosicoccus sp.]
MADILLIEDSPTDAHAYSKILRKSGHDVRVAITGEEGMDMARQAQPDVILMDIVMPGVNGFEATRLLQRDRVTADIPVIMLSTKDQETDRIWGLRQGAIDYLVKPVSRQNLLRSVDSALAGA